MADAAVQLATADSSINDGVNRRLKALKEKYAGSHAEVAGELSKLARTYPPSRFAFLIIAVLAIGIDVLNYFVDVAIVADLILSVVFVLCIRAMINRPKRTQRLLAAMIVAAIAFSVLLPVIGSVFGFPLLAIVMFMGAVNGGVKVQKVDKEKITRSLQKIEQSIRVARTYAARLIKLGRRTKALRSITTKLARSKAFKTFSKNSKTTARLAGSAVAESIPFLAWIPFNTVNAFWTYFDLAKAHREAGEMLEEYRQQEETAVSLEEDVVREQYRAEQSRLQQQAQVVADEEFEDEQVHEEQLRVASQAPTPVRVRDAIQRDTMRDVNPPQRAASTERAASVSSPSTTPARIAA